MIFRNQPREAKRAGRTKKEKEPNPEGVHRRTPSTPITPAVAHPSPSVLEEGGQACLGKLPNIRDSPVKGERLAHYEVNA